MDSISGISDGAQTFLGLAAAQLGINPGNAGLLANTSLLGDGSAVFVRPFQTDNNPDDRRKVNMDYEPTYFAEEEMFQLQLTHDEGVFKGKKPILIRHLKLIINAINEQKTRNKKT